MSSIITGLGSGFDITSWVSQLVAAKEATLLTPLQTKLNTLQGKSSAYTTLKSKYSTLQSALQTFTRTIYNSSSDMWTNTKINSSNDAYASAVSSGLVASGSIQLQIEQIATATIAKSSQPLGQLTEENAGKIKFTSLANSQAKAGSFTMFLNGKQYSIDIEENDSLKDVMEKISKASEGKIQAKINSDGTFSIKAYKEISSGRGQKQWVEDTNAVLTLGAKADKSNLASALKLLDKQNGETHSYTSSYSISSVNTSSAMASEESGLGGIKFFNEEDGAEAESGTITINGVDFEIDKTTTLNSLISKINGNSETKVKASYDSLTNKLVLTSTETGESNISLSEKGTNLLNVLGLTQMKGEDEVLAEGSQTLGQNAIVYINGNRVVSASNTITGESSGISNLSLTVKKQTSDYSHNEDDEQTITLDIEPDYTEVKEALSKFVEAYNDVISSTKTATGTDGAIGRDISLNSLLSNIKNITSQVSDNDGVFSMLAEIGISSSKTDLGQLEIDDERLDKALKENFESVKQLLSDGYTEKADNGLFDGLLNTVNSILDNETGYFTNMEDSIQRQITSMNTRIERATTRLTNYETRITKQFNKMDETISALSSQLSTFQSYMGY